MTIKRALIVDDSTTAQYRLKKMLRRYPLDIDIVDSGEAALRYLARHAPAVIFMDHLMPGIDGFRALQIIKSNPDTAMIPVIMYTSKSGDVYTGQARALGALDVVSKDRINATDLSKVMETIHIYPNAKADASDIVESAELIAAANQVTTTADSLEETNTPPLDRRTSSLEQARNLDLRLSHMEHSLEDNRRFITSRVVRELQGLRQNLRQEFSDILQQQPAIPAPAAPAPVAETKTGNSGWSMFAIFLSVIALAVIAYFLLLINNQLNQNQAQQDAISKQLQQVVTQANKEPEMISPAILNAAINQPIKPFMVPDNNLLVDLAWTFNQGGALAFNQNTIDPKPLLRLHELLHRLASNGFKGTATVNIYVGDFCVTVDNMGMTQLAPTNKTLGDCMLSSEIYTIERLMDDYTREVSMILGNLTRDVNSTIKIAITVAPGAEMYPERIPTVNARDWNQIAQHNNRLELVLVADEEQ
ncbi:MAG: response regulator [Cellvibrio sp.]|uniref:PleD family two-component system response regulator n=1 Tax=Cellvibrio sp. TaxID=1965322 RepID=UPI00271D11FF|nr:response regulator [Cellvibrio sp.]